MVRGDFTRWRCKAILQSAVVVPNLVCRESARGSGCQIEKPEGRYAKQRRDRSCHTPLGGGIGEVTLFSDEAAVLASTTAVLVAQGRGFLLRRPASIVARERCRRVGEEGRDPGDW